MRFFKKITIIKISSQKDNTLNDRLQFLGSSIGLFNQRDKDRSCFRIFIELLKAGKNNESLSSDEIAFRLDLSRGTVIHHIHNLEDAGIVISTKGKYHLKVTCMEELVNEIEKDINSTLRDLKHISKKIDEELELK